MRLVKYYGLIFAAIVLAVSLAACSDTSGTSATNDSGGNATSTVTSTTVGGGAAPTATSTSASSSVYNVKVYFSKHPDSDNNINTVFPVHRTAPNLQVATYTIQQLILGPTSAEQSSGYYTPLTSAITGASNCGGADFQITLNMKGTTPVQGTATLKFCRIVQLAGDLTGGLIKAEIVASLKQFSTISNVVILTSAGSCFDDESGQNLCLS